MRQILRMSAVLVLLTGASLASAGTAAALPTADFTVSSTTQTFGDVATYTSLSVCDEPPCRYQWRWFRADGTDRLGSTMGEGETLDFTFDSPGQKNVLLKVTNSNSTHGSATSSQVIEVLPATPVDPAPVDPPADPAPVDPPADPAPVDPPVDSPAPVDPPTDTPAPVDPPADNPPVDNPAPVDPPTDVPAPVDPPVDNPAPVDPPTDTPAPVDSPAPVDPPAVDPAPVDPPADTAAQADPGIEVPPPWDGDFWVGFWSHFIPIPAD